MRGVKPSAFLFLLTVSSGILMESPSLMAFGLGLSLFIPALFIYAQLHNGIFFPTISSVLSLILLFFLAKNTVLDVASFLLLAPTYTALKRFGVAGKVIGGALLLTAATVIEEKISGIPQEVKRELSNLESFRFSLYFFSSAVFSAIAYSITSWINREFPSITSLRFGFWSVVLFTLSAAGTLLGGGVLKILSVNLLIVSITLLTLQGIAVFFHFFPRFPSLWKLITGFLIFIFPPGFLLTALILGLLDQKFDFRKHKGGKEDGSNPS